jgi:hypothetical protein
MAGAGGGIGAGVAAGALAALAFAVGAAALAAAASFPARGAQAPTARNADAQIRSFFIADALFLSPATMSSAIA